MHTNDVVGTKRQALSDWRSSQWAQSTRFVLRRYIGASRTASTGATSRKSLTKNERMQIKLRKLARGAKP